MGACEEHRLRCRDGSHRLLSWSCTQGFRERRQRSDHVDRAVDHALRLDRPFHCGFDRVLGTDFSNRLNPAVNKKAKKRLEVINKKLQTLRPRLSGSRAQADDAEELKQLEEEIAKLEAEAAELKASK